MTITTPELFLLLIAVSGPLKVTIVCATLTATASANFINRVAAGAVVISASVFVLFIVWAVCCCTSSMSQSLPFRSAAGSS